MTTKGEWVAYTGSYEQIAEFRAATNGVLIRLADDKPGDNEFILGKDKDFNRCISEYWIIPDDPLREMKIRQAMTGQPVWIRVPLGYSNAAGLVTKLRDTDIVIKDTGEMAVIVTTTPDWHISNAEYCFTAFEE